LAVLKNVDEALTLPAGRLGMYFTGGMLMETSFSLENVVEAAQVVLENNPKASLYSQAGVIVEAGKHGWGLGNVYKTI
jgi:hypothetical protein